MRALVFTGPATMVLEDRAALKAGHGEAVVAVAAAGICGSDIHGYAGASGRRTPGVVMGHEIAGSVIDVGPGVDPSMLGSRVVVFPLLTCGRCAWCLGGSAQLCAQRRYVGIDRDGGFAEQVLVPASNLVPIPDGLDPAVASLAEPAAVALHAIRRAPDLAGAAVLVTGAGPIGLLMARAASVIGKASRVTNSEVSPARRDVAAQLGISTIDPSAEGWLESVRGADDAGVDVVFEGVGVQASLDAALAAVRTRGCVVFASGWRTVSVALGSLVTREIETRGTFNFTRVEFEAALPFLAQVNASRLATVRTSLSDAPAVFARLSEDQGASIKTVITP
jgi:L-iditol 2-dehydrogenase